MTIQAVLMIGNPALRESSGELSREDPMFEEILLDLKDTLTNLQETRMIGRALAAPQIGILKKVVYFQMPENTFHMINPEITEKSEEMIEVWDSCFSFDVAFFVRVPRHKSIKVRFQDTQGNKIEKEYEGDMSELVQHEVDHLFGILATDLLKGPKSIMMREEWEKRFGQDWRFNPLK